MAGYILDAGATITCPHGGRVTVAAQATRVALGGKPPLLRRRHSGDRRLPVQRLRRAVARA